MNHLIKGSDLNIKEIEKVLIRETARVSSVTTPFVWINRQGDAIQDYGIEVGDKRTLDLIEKYNLKMSYDQLFDYWIRVDGLSVTINTEPTQLQVNGLVKMFGEFPGLYKKMPDRIKFTSTKFKNVKFNKHGNEKLTMEDL